MGDGHGGDQGGLFKEVQAAGDLLKDAREDRGIHAHDAFLGGRGRIALPPKEDQLLLLLRRPHRQLGLGVEVLPADDLEAIQQLALRVKPGYLDETHRAQQAGERNDHLLELGYPLGARLARQREGHKASGGIKDAADHRLRKAIAGPVTAVGVGAPKYYQERKQRRERLVPMAVDIPCLPMNALEVRGDERGVPFKVLQEGAQQGDR
mmetsp:Transcript_89691/g.238281  ORF Transcript_89691/g.238281 Transcript_89691/m.238281 type:complete len:208 (+) Transcript_89691:526-1149(+)